MQKQLLIFLSAFGIVSTLANECALKASTGINAVSCDNCQKIVRNIGSRLFESGQAAKVRDQLKAICNFYDGYDHESCLTVIDHLDFTSVKDSINECKLPVSLCQQTFMCGAKQVPKLIELALGHMAEHSASGLIEVPMLLDQLAGYDLAARFKKHIQNNADKTQPGCMTCQVFVTGLTTTLLGSDADQKAICSTLQNWACNVFLPAAPSPDCNNLLGMYLQAVLQMTLEQIQMMSPAMCVKVKMCSASDMRTFVSTAGNGAFCSSCNIIIDFIQSEIAEFKNLAHQTCTTMPAHQVEQCHQMATPFFDAMIEYLQHGGVCKSLKAEC